jgi:hypothetical protein
MIKFLLEGYDNMVQLSTIDMSIPKIQLTVAPDFLEMVLEIIEDLKTKYYLENLNEDSTKSQARY